MVGLEETKKYLRVDYDDEDSLITSLITSAASLCLGVLRSDDEALLENEEGKLAVLYAVAYLFEHREEADHKELMLTLRQLLFAKRNEGF